MKRIVIVLIVVLSLSLYVSAYAMEVPTGTVVQNLNGSQQCIKTYTVSPDTDPGSLIEEPFELEGYSYAYASITKQENHFADECQHIETVTVETSKKDLSTVLEALAPTMEYSDGQYTGILNLDHTSIVTEAAGYTRKSYTVSDTKEYDALPSNDMAQIPATSVKDGVTLNLAGVDWQVQATALVDDVLVPSLYKAVVSYSGSSSYSAATGYITTAEYSGVISSSGVESVTYTITYLGTVIPEPEVPDEEQTAEENISRAAEFFKKNGWIIGCAAAVVAAATFAVLYIRKRQELAQLEHAYDSERVLDADYEEMEDSE